MTQDQARHFIERGYLVLDDCVDPAARESWVDRAYQRLGYRPDDPSTWSKEIVWMDRESVAPVSVLSPRAWGALCDVLGGEERIDPTIYEIESNHFTTINSFEWSDAFIVNFRRGADAPWVAPSAECGGWHKDGSYFRHFLDSREQALLPVVYWSDVEPKGGGTFFAPDSIPLIAEHLAGHPEGVTAGGFGAMIEQCSDFRELSGPAGTFVIMHPFMLHASSNNHSGKARFMSNPPAVLREPMRLARPDRTDYSLLERATLHALGVDRFEFEATAPRESYWQVAAE